MVRPKRTGIILLLLAALLQQIQYEGELRRRRRRLLFVINRQQKELVCELKLSHVKGGGRAEHNKWLKRRDDRDHQDRTEGAEQRRQTLGLFTHSLAVLLKLIRRSKEHGAQEFNEYSSLICQRACGQGRQWFNCGRYGQEWKRVGRWGQEEQCK